MEPTAEVAPPGAAVPRRVWRATALQVLGRVWGASCTLAILYLAALRLERAEFGRLTFYLALFLWLDALVNLGTGQVAVQRTAGHPERVPAVLAAARRIRLATGLAGVLLVGGGALAAGEPGAGWILLATLYPVTHVLELPTVVFRNRIAWGVPVAIRAVAAGLSLSFVLLLWLSGGDRPAPYLVAVALGSSIGNLLLFLASRRHLPRGEGPVRPASGVLRAALPLGLASICAQTYFYVDNLYVRLFLGEEPLGPYNVAVRLMSWTIMVAQYASLSALPWLTRRHREGHLGAAVSGFGPALFALAGFGAGLVLPWTSELLELFRPGFGTAAASLRWLLAAAAVIHAGAVLLTAVVASGNMRAMLAITASALLFNLLANLWAVPALGITGAGLVTFATECWVALAAAWTLSRLGVRPWEPGRAWLWLGGPALFALGAGLSSLLPLG